MIFSEMYTSKYHYAYCTVGTNNQIKNSKPVVRFQANDVFKARHSYGRITNISYNKQTLQSVAKYTSKLRHGYCTIRAPPPPPSPTYPENNNKQPRINQTGDDACCLKYITPSLHSIPAMETYPSLAILSIIHRVDPQTLLLFIAFI